MNIGNTLRDLRKKKGLTQRELAEKIYTSEKTISSWEVNRTEPNLETLIKLSEVFGCTISYLVYGNNTKNNIETEIKIKLSCLEYENIKRIMEEKAIFQKETKQVDKYYEPTYRKFLGNDTINEWLRIGLRGNKKILNYKNWHDNKYCDEYEVEIDNEDNLEKIFKVLGLEEIALVSKTRRTYLYLDKYEVALDIVLNLGYFIEIEVKKIEKSSLEEYDDLILEFVSKNA